MTGPILLRAAAGLGYAALAWIAAQRGVGVASGDADAAYRAGEVVRATEYNPRHAAAWIARGLAAEAGGDGGAAEASLLRAAAVDHGYLPAWTLANFYLRTNREEDFWRWARRAAEMAYAPDALYQLCWRISGDGEEILDRAIPPRARRSYLGFLSQTKRAYAAGGIPEQLMQEGRAADTSLLLDYCDAAIAEGLADEAGRVWNVFGADARGRCFDWRIVEAPGTRVTFDRAAAELTVALSGRQPESCEIAGKFEPFESGIVSFRYRSVDLPEPSGLAWSFEKTATGLGRAVLRYRRPQGSTRAEGTAVFAGLAIERTR